MRYPVADAHGAHKKYATGYMQATCVLPVQANSEAMS